MIDSANVMKSFKEEIEKGVSVSVKIFYLDLIDNNFGFQKIEKKINSFEDLNFWLEQNKENGALLIGEKKPESVLDIDVNPGDIVLFQISPRLVGKWQFFTRKIVSYTKPDADGKPTKKSNEHTTISIGCEEKEVKYLEWKHGQYCAFKCSESDDGEEKKLKRFAYDLHIENTVPKINSTDGRMKIYHTQIIIDPTIRNRPL